MKRKNNLVDSLFPGLEVPAEGLVITMTIRRPEIAKKKIRKMA